MTLAAKEGLALTNGTTVMCAPGTIRADLAESIEANTVHGSDSLENAAIEIAYFFAQTEIHSR